MKQRIIDYIRRNRVSSTEVADCLGKRGAILDIRAINRGHFEVGNLFWAYANAGTNWDVHEQVQGVQPGDVVFVEVFDCGGRAIFGDLVAKYLLLYKQAAALVVNGNLRDAPRLLKENWPIWCQGFNPVGCVNEKPVRRFNPRLLRDRTAKYQRAIAVCDDTGVVVIPKESHTADFFQKLEFIEKQEDIWYECIDRKKMSTFEAVCLKKYRAPKLRSV